MLAGRQKGNKEAAKFVTSKFCSILRLTWLGWEIAVQQQNLKNLSIAYGYSTNILAYAVGLPILGRDVKGFMNQ